MTSGLPEIGASAELDLGNWNRSINQMVASTARVEDAIADAKSAANELEAALTIDGDVEINVAVEDGDLVEAKRKRDDLDEDTSFTATSSYSDLIDADSTHDELTEDTTFTANADGLVEINENLEDIKSINRTQLLLQFAEIGLAGIRMAIDGIRSLAGTIIDPLLEVDSAVGLIEARTGEAIPNAEELINGIFVQGLGDSRAQIAEVLALLVQSGVEFDNLGGAAETAFETALSQGLEVNEVIRAQQSLVQSGLVDSYDEAAGFIVTGFQNGLNAAGDFLDTINEYSGDFSSMGLSGQAALNLLESGLSGTFDTTNRVAESLRQLQNQINQTDNTQVTDALTALGQTDATAAFQQGELAGDQYLQGLLDAISAVEDPVAQQGFVTTLFGAQAEDFGATAVTALETTSKAMEDLTANADAAAEAVTDNLQFAFMELQRFVTQELVDALDSALDISGFIDRAKEAIQVFFTSIESGEGFLESLDVSLSMLGLDDAFEGLEHALADTALFILQGVRAVADLIPGVDVGGLDNLIAGLGTQQLGVSLTLADDEGDFTDSIQDALNRGVEASDIAQQLADQLTDAISEGVDPARIRELSNALGAFQAGGVEFDSSQVDAAVQGVLAQMNTAFAAGDLTGALDLAQMIGDQGSIDSLSQQIHYNIVQGVNNGLDGVEDEIQVLDWAAAIAPEGTSATDQLAGEVGTEAAAQIVGDLTAEFDTAIASGDLDLAGRIAEGLDNDTLREQLAVAQEASETTSQAMADATEIVIDAYTTSGDEIATSTGEMGESLTGLQGVAATATEAVSGSVTVMVDNIDMENQRLKDIASDIALTLSGISSDIASVDVSVATSGGGNSSIGLQANATGGNVDPGFFSAAPGEELMFTTSPLSILSGPMTDSLISAIEAMSGGSTTVNNYYNLSQVVNTQSQAQDYMANNQLAAQVRGF